MSYFLSRHVETLATPTIDETPAPVQRSIDVLFLVPVRFNVLVNDGTSEEAMNFALKAVNAGDQLARIDWDAKSPAVISSCKLANDPSVSETVPQRVSVLRLFAEWHFLRQCVT